MATIKGSRGIIAPQTQDKKFANAAEHDTNDNAKIVELVMVSCQFLMEGGRDGVGMMLRSQAHSYMTGRASAMRPQPRLRGGGRHSRVPWTVGK